VLGTPVEVGAALRRGVHGVEDLPVGVQVVNRARDLQVQDAGLIADGLPRVDRAAGLIDVAARPGDLASAQDLPWL